MSRAVLHVMGVVFALMLCTDVSVPAADAMGDKGDMSGVSSQDRTKVFSPVERILAAGNPSREAPSGARADPQGNVQKLIAQGPRPRVVQASLRSEGSPDAESDLAGTIPGSPGQLLLRGFPAPAIPLETLTDAAPKARQLRSPALLERGQMEAVLMPGEQLRSVGNLPTTVEERLKAEAAKLVEIEVSHSGHELRLLRFRYADNAEVLHQCRVGLGSPGFPTPVGVYYVTHIYDEEPWWIPPPNRAWAAGQSPSKKVYGGTMAPLLKKRSVKTKEKEPVAVEDKIEGAVKLDDYGYRFHGTNAPRSIGRNESHGCVRMLPADAKTVASLIKDNVGVAHRRESANGSFVILKSPVRLNLIR